MHGWNLRPFTPQSDEEEAIFASLSSLQTIIYGLISKNQNLEKRLKAAENEIISIKGKVWGQRET